MHATRLHILRHLAGRPANLTELARWAGIQKSAAHKHLQALVADGHVVRTPTRRWVYYRLAPAGHAMVLAVVGGM